ncbi:hypothetical protein N8I74_08115 [Chitiniphilus purpureus]|uniref:Uncharacterized protein n=1 Tax=Chitiniphilus purpureus TaxID=2981137 RepID=A0ABY6DTY6_9NEIS|nr:hypothetical protein [Chitiniphilus sp. CD1]UXY16961.1 hypothetical protein N8I74_08115 [Chitiniphilus sp. CD1]
MSTDLIALLRQLLPSIYSNHLPDEIRYRRADSHDVVVPLDAATVDELAFAIQLVNVELLALGQRRDALEPMPIRFFQCITGQMHRLREPLKHCVLYRSRTLIRSCRRSIDR